MLCGEQDKQRRLLVGEKTSCVSSHMNDIDDFIEGCFVERMRTKTDERVEEWVLVEEVCELS